MNARVVLLSGLALSLVAAAPATAQDYPTKPITIVSAQAGGGASDTIGRMVSERLQAALGQPVLIESRPGASGNVGAAAVARAAPDGYTLMIGTDAMMTSNVHLFKTMPFDPVKDFAPITNGGATTSSCWRCMPTLPVKSVAELVAYAKANPGKLQFGSSGVASPHHLAGELLKLKTGIDIVHVPYRGGSLSANDLVGGHIGMAFLSYSAAAPVLPTGKIRILGVVEKTRYAAIPDVPTVAETVPGFEMTSWLGFFAPAGTPRADRRAAQHRAREDPQCRHGEGAARLARACGRGRNAGSARRNRAQRHRGARRADQGRQDRAAVTLPARHPAVAPLPARGG